MTDIVDGRQVEVANEGATGKWQKAKGKPERSNASILGLPTAYCLLPFYNQSTTKS